MLKAFPLNHMWRLKGKETFINHRWYNNLLRKSKRIDIYVIRINKKTTNLVNLGSIYKNFYKLQINKKLIKR